MAQIVETTVKCRDCLVKSDAAKTLTDEELDLLGRGCTDVRFKNGERIFTEGLPHSHVIYLREGHAKVHMMGPNGRDQILSIAQPGVFIGIQTLLGGEINHYSATALHNIRVCYISGSVFKELISSNGRFASNILTWVCQEELKYFRKFVDMQQKHVSGRVADALLNFSDEIYNNRTFILPFSYIDLAALIGTTRESVTRTIREYVTSGLIEVKNREFKIRDYERLNNISENG